MAGVPFYLAQNISKVKPTDYSVDELGNVIPPQVIEQDEPVTQQDIMPAPKPVQPIPQAPMPQMKSFTEMQRTSGQSADDAEFDAMADRAYNYEGFEPQRESITAMKKSLEEYLAKPTQVNLMPLMALTDAWTGSKFAQSYNVPTSKEERDQVANKFRQTLYQMQSGLSDDELKLMQSQLTAKQTAELKKLGFAEARSKLGIAREDRESEIAQRVRKDVLGSEQGKQITGILSFGNALDNYDSLVDKHGLNPTGVGAAELTGAYSKLQTAYKEAEKLGALAGPDLEILRNAVRDAGGFSSWFSSLSKGGLEGVKAQINQMRVSAQNDYRRSLDDLKSFDPNSYASDMYQNWDRKNMKLKKPRSETPDIQIGQELSDGKGGVIVYRGGDVMDPSSYAPKSATAGK